MGRRHDPGLFRAELLSRIAVIGQFRLPPEAMAEARPYLAAVVEASRAEPGCLAYAYAEDVLEPGLVRASELWQDRASLAAHFASAHMREWQERRARLGMTGRSVFAYAVDAGEEL